MTSSSRRGSCYFFGKVGTDMDSQNDKKAYIETLLMNYQKNGMDKDTMELVKGDLYAGVAAEDVQEYVKASHNMGQKKAYSRAYRMDCPRAVINMFYELNADAQRMNEALDAVDHGIDTDTILNTFPEYKNPGELRKAFNRITETVAKAKIEAEGEQAFVKDALVRIEQLVKGMEPDRIFLEEVSKQIKELGISKEKESEALALMKEECAKRDRIISDKQVELEDMEKLLRGKEETIAKQRKELDDLMRTIDVMREERRKEQELAEEKAEQRKEQQEVTDKHVVSETDNEKRAPQYYQACITNSDGTKIPIEVDHTEKRQPKNILYLASELLGTSRMKKSLMKRMAENSLSAEQISMVALAVKSGLTDDDVAEMIESDFSKEQMQAAIDVMVNYANKEA